MANRIKFHNKFSVLFLTCKNIDVQNFHKYSYFKWLHLSSDDFNINFFFFLPFEKVVKNLVKIQKFLRYLVYKNIYKK